MIRVYDYEETATNYPLSTGGGDNPPETLISSLYESADKYLDRINYTST